MDIRSFVSKPIVIVIISLLVISGITLPFILKDDKVVVEDYVSNLSTATEEYKTGLEAGLTINKTNFYKGQNIPASLDVTVFNSYAYIDVLIIEVKLGQRVANQIITINQTLAPGDHRIFFEIGVSFQNEGFIALNYGSYTFSSFSLIYSQRHEGEKFTKILDHQVSISAWPRFEQMKSRVWNTTSNESNITIKSGSPTNITLISTGNSSTVFMSTSIVTRGYTALHYNVYGSINSTVKISLNNTGIWANAGNGSLGIGELSSDIILIIDAVIDPAEQIIISLSLTTQYNPIFVVSANNNWGGMASDGLFFEPPEFYINQVSSRYINIFNISFIEVADIYFSSTTSSDLFKLIDEANAEIGRVLELNGNTWNLGSGPQAGNFGADIELIFTNKTMDHLGIVIGAAGEAFNIAVNARGSNFEGNYRLLSTMADNLLQHEMSHIFGAPDRWTATSDPSIMSKSQPNDSYLDILFGRFWLLRINWLELDIQRMSEKSINFLGNLE